MIYISHAANILILTAVCTALLRDGSGMTDAFGPDSPARRILTCVYLAILLASAVALIAPLVGAATLALRIALVLFPLQIVYKTATAFALGVGHPVVQANLGVVALHCVTLAVVLARA